MARDIKSLSSDGLTLHSVTDKPDGSYSAPTDTWQLIVLHEILMELRKLNRLLHCQNFQAIPFKLDKVVKNTTKKKRKKVAPKLRIVA